MSCQICGDTQGPFGLIEHRKRVIFACENCEKKIEKEKKRMIQPIYAIRDMLIEFHAPVVGINDEQIERDFKVYCSKKAEIEQKDLQLYKIGEFDTVTGKITPIEPLYICGGFE